MSVREALLFPVADSLQIAMHPVGSKYIGKAKQLMKVGLWNITAEASLISDVLSQECASFIVHIMKDLWLHVISQEDGKKLTAKVINGSLCGLNEKTFQSYGTGNLETTTAKLAKGWVCTYHYKDDRWRI